MAASSYRGQVTDPRSLLLLSIARDAPEFFSLSWDGLRSATSKEETLNLLVHQINKGFPTQQSHLDTRITAFSSIRQGMFVQDGVVLYIDRVVIPSSLRDSAFSSSRCRRQGIHSSLHYQLAKDVKMARESCIECCRIAPSQPAMPSTESTIPSTPFDAIVADFFQTKGHHFVVVADRLSGWVEMFSAPPPLEQIDTFVPTFRGAMLNPPSILWSVRPWCGAYIVSSIIKEYFFKCYFHLFYI